MHARDPRYGTWLIRLHWLTLLLLVAVYSCIELRELFPRGSVPRVALKEWHYFLGLTVFVVVWVRLAVRMKGTVPGILPSPPAWQSRIAAVMHVALYAFMIAMPLLGWATLSAGGELPTWLGVQLPALLSPSEPLEERLEELHETVGVAGYWLIGLHALAGLAHHYLLRDNTLRRMLPRWAGASR